MRIYKKTLSKWLSLSGIVKHCLYRFSLRKIAAFLGFEGDQGRIDCAVNFSTGELWVERAD